MNTQKQHLVSIGLPVYNEVRSIRRALDGWLAQTYENFELIVVDNASTDGTVEICREYAARDPRIRLVENPQNVGPVRNHELVFELSRGKYFVWAGGHDHVHPAFVSKKVPVLDSNETVVMCTARSEFRDENDVCWRTSVGGLDTRGLPPHERFRQLLVHTTTGGTANIFYALYRRSVLSSVLGFKKTIGADVILLSQIALQGDVVQLDDVLYYRFVPSRQDRENRLRRHVKDIVSGEDFHVNSRMPYVGMLFAYMQVVEESRLPVASRQMMFQVIRDEVFRLKATLSSELTAFMQEGQHELEANRDFPEIQRYRALQILDGLNRAEFLEIKDRQLNALKVACHEILGKISGTSPVRKNQNHVFRVLSKVRKYFQRT